MAYAKQTWADGSGGGTPITAARLSYMENGIEAAAAGGGSTVETIPAGSTLTVPKDPTTGFWPSGWNADGTPSYVGGANNAGVRPTARADVFIQWKGADPSPAVVSSGTGGMRDGIDSRFVTP